MAAPVIALLTSRYIRIILLPLHNKGGIRGGGSAQIYLIYNGPSLPSFFSFLQWQIASLQIESRTLSFSLLDHGWEKKEKKREAGERLVHSTQAEAKVIRLFFSATTENTITDATRLASSSFTIHASSILTSDKTSLEVHDGMTFLITN